MAPWDEWWNRKFPPYSWKRLYFLCACMPFIAVLVGITRIFTDGEKFSWSGVVVVTLMGWTMLPLMWLHIRNSKADGIDVTPAREDTPFPTPSPLPPEWPRHPDPRRDEEMSEIQREAVLGLKQRSRPPRNDALYAFGIALVGFIAFMAMMGSNPFEPATFGMTVLFAAFFVLMIRFRYSIWSVVLLSALAAIPCAVFFDLFFMFMGGGDSFVVTWAFCFLLVFSFIAPVWWRIRRTRHHPVLGRIPMWILSAGATSTLVIVGAAVTMSGDVGTPAQAGPESDMGGFDVGSADPHFGAATKEEAGLRLYHAWRSGSREYALKVAHERAVDDLFSRSFDPSATFRGCGTDADGYSKCVIGVSDGLILAAPEISSNGNQYIRYIEHVAPGYPITYTQPSPPAAPTPTPSTTPSRIKAPDTDV